MIIDYDTAYSGERREALESYRHAPHKWPQRMWLDVGLREGTETVRNVRRLRDTLRARGWVLGDDLRYYEARHGDHSERAWAARVGPFLRFLFPPVGEQRSRTSRP